MRPAASQRLTAGGTKENRNSALPFPFLFSLHIMSLDTDEGCTICHHGDDLFGGGQLAGDRPCLRERALCIGLDNNASAHLQSAREREWARAGCSAINSVEFLAGKSGDCIPLLSPSKCTPRCSGDEESKREAKYTTEASAFLFFLISLTKQVTTISQEYSTVNKSSSWTQLSVREYYNIRVITLLYFEGFCWSISF